MYFSICSIGYKPENYKAPFQFDLKLYIKKQKIAFYFISKVKYSIKTELHWFNT